MRMRGIYASHDQETEREWWVVVTTASKAGRRKLMRRSQEWCRPASSSQSSRAERCLLPVMAFRDPLPFQLIIEVAQQDAIIQQQQQQEVEEEEEGRWERVACVWSSRAKAYLCREPAPW